MGRFTSPVKASGFNGFRWWWTTWEAALNAHSLLHTANGAIRDPANTHTHAAICPWSHPSVGGSTSGPRLFLHANIFTNKILRTKTESGREQQSASVCLCMRLHFCMCELTFTSLQPLIIARLIYFPLFYPLSLPLSKTKVTIMGI